MSLSQFIDISGSKQSFLSMILKNGTRAAVLALFFLKILGFSRIKTEFIEHFHSRSQHLWKYLGKKKTFT